MHKSNKIDMTTGKILPKLLAFAIPLMLTGILQLLYNAADIIVVGRFAGEQCLAAVGATSTINTLFTTVFIGLSVGTSAIAARCFGSRDYEGFSKVMHTAVALGFIIGIGSFVLGQFSLTSFLTITKTPSDIINLSELYMRIIFIGTPAQILYNYGASILRSIGNTRTPLLILSFAGILNVILNLILVIAFDMHVAGVAIATIFSQYISAILVLIILAKLDGLPKFEFKKIKVHKEYISPILKIGVPAAINSSLFSLSNILIQSAINSYGYVVVAGNTVGHNIEAFIYACVESFESTSLTFTSQNKGSRNLKRIKQGAVTSVITVTVIGLIVGSLAYIFGKPLASVYTDSSEAINYAVFRLSIIAITYFLNGIMHAFTGVMRGLGHSTRPMLISIITVCVLRFMFVLYIFPLVQNMPNNLGLALVYATWPVSWLLTIICYTGLLVYFIKQEKKTIIA